MSNVKWYVSDIFFILSINKNMHTLSNEINIDFNWSRNAQIYMHLFIFIIPIIIIHMRVIVVMTNNYLHILSPSV